MGSNCSGWNEKSLRCKLPGRTMEQGVGDPSPGEAPGRYWTPGSSRLNVSSALSDAGSIGTAVLGRGQMGQRLASWSPNMVSWLPGRFSPSSQLNVAGQLGSGCRLWAPLPGLAHESPPPDPSLSSPLADSMEGIPRTWRRVEPPSRGYLSSAGPHGVLVSIFTGLSVVTD